MRPPLSNEENKNMSALIELQNISLKAAELVEEGRVHKSLYSDPAIFEEDKP